MQMLRHGKIAVTMDIIYTEAPSAATRDALRKLGRVAGRLSRAVVTVLLHVAAAPRSKTAGYCYDQAADLGGRYWDRTSDLLGVNEALSR